MHSPSLLLVISALAQVAVQVSGAKAPYLLNGAQCTEKNIERIDRGIAKLLGFGPNGRPFPENSQQLKGYCSETTRLITLIDGSIKKCFRKDIRDLANILIYSLKSNVRQFCRRRSRRLTTLLASTTCVNRQIRDDGCIRLFTNSTKELINVQVDDQPKIRYACCNYVRSMRCSDAWLDRHGCGADKEIMLDFVRGVFGSFTDVMCGEYSETTDRCDELGTQPKALTPNKKRYATFFFILLDLMESFKNFQLPNSK